MKGPGPREALALLQEERFDLLFVDIQMPDMDGYEVTAAVRAMEAGGRVLTRGGGRRLPIIVMTAHAMSGVREECIAKGMDGYVSKPVEDAKLAEAMRQVLDLDAKCQPPHDAEATPRLGLDKAKALAGAGGNVQLLRELIGVFKKDCSKLTEEIRNALEGKDAVVVGRAGHTLKGMVSFFGRRPPRRRRCASSKWGARGT